MLINLGCLNNSETTDQEGDVVARVVEGLDI